jgi:pyruvate dehydrogenase E2 component (dihydrolipoamide acetyltransferase)
MPEMLMPKLSDTMEEGTVLRWFKADGDQVAKGEPLVEIETDKATMTVEAPNDGTLAIIAREGDTLDVGAPIAMIGDGAPKGVEPPGTRSTETASTTDGPAAPGEGTVATGIPTTDDGTADTIAAATPAAASPTPTPATSSPAPTPPPTTPPVTATGDRIPASPLARNIAAHHGIDLATVTGTGPGGRIVKHDVEAVIAGAPTGVEPPGTRSAESASTEAGPAAPIGTDSQSSTTPPLGGAAPVQPVPPKLPPPVPRGDWPAGRRTPLTRLQKTISRRMTDAHAVPDFTLERDIDTTALEAARADLRVALPEDQRPSLNDLIIRAVAMAARERPDMVSRLDGDDLVVPQSVDVGVAVSVPGGLIVPVVRNADQKGVPQIAAEVRDLARRGRAGELRPDELEGSAISVSNLGMFGVDRFHAVINAPEAAIVGVGRSVERPVVVDGHVVVREVMTLTLSVDHRVAYGAEGATFLARIAELLEHPAALLV